MPLDPVNDRRPPITPQLAVRVATLGVCAFVLFGIVFFRLWYLQVLDGDQYLAQARENRVRVERIQAPRGNIVDRNGLTLVENRRATVVSLDPRRIPERIRSAAATWGQQVSRRDARPKGRKGARIPMPRNDDPQLQALYRRLGRVLRLPPQSIHRRVIASLVQVPYADIRIKTDVSAAQRDYMEERRDQFPGVRVDQAYLRSYPNRSLAAQLIGTIGEINERQLDQKRYKGVKQGTFVGQNGLEATYDRYLRGRDGAYRILVNALGERRGAVTARAPRSGRQLKLTLDIGLQQAGERALLQAGGGRPGAFVAMDPTTGAVMAMGSYPTYDPRELTKPFETKAAYDRKFGRAAGDPLFNRAIGGFYPTGSTFKPITAIAALASGQTSPGRVVGDSGCIQIGARTVDVACNAGKVANGPVNLVRALQVSSDVYFYQLGLDMNPDRRLPLQRWAKRLGLGRTTGIDVPGEGSGLVPDPAWRADRGKLEAKCRRKKKIPLSAEGPVAAAAGCGISDMRPWTPGDETNLSVGQGDLQASPLQMAVAYSSIVNGGKVPRPHLGAEVQDDQGRIVQRLETPAARRAKLDPTWQQNIMEGLRLAASAPGGTSYDVFKDWPHSRYPIYGKTGTAERAGRPDDQSWYVAYSHDVTRANGHPIVIAATIEDGGFGAEAAAPAVRLMLSKWFNVKAKLVRGTSHTR
jgi:penicillin-binding protein 2